MAPRQSSDAGVASGPLTVVSVRDALRHELRARILSGAQMPGTKLIEEDVARRYQVARPTARQVIQDLVFEGLLRRRPNRSAEVPVLTAEDVREIFAIRELIEVVAMRRLTQRREAPEEMARAVELLEQLSEEEVAASDEGWASVVDHDQTFHAALVDTLSNRRLARMYASVQAENRLCLAQERHAYASVADVAREHRELMDAILTESPEAAVELLLTHLHEACERVVAVAQNAQGAQGAQGAEPTSAPGEQG
jgi:DNA-binding GntR family transcriptional regulator